MTSPLERLDRALVEEATKKSGLIWVKGTDAPARPLWHAWHEGAAHVLGDGPGEQPLTGLESGGTAQVTVRSKDKGGRLVTWTARVARVEPGTDEYAAAVAELKAKRLNAPDGEAMVDRWARECRLLRLEPTGETLPMPEGDLAASPVPTPATTRQPVPAGVPKLLFRKRKQNNPR
ncbi:MULTISPECIES: hypothetical protein [unclassified Streptomyces]|uniref:hypothetical protein n=1 Tax=unclassified Streptomyces TaxID=2593676 RepID=UPI000DD62CE5|nr:MULTISPECIES: hypothetical protein [unclassified Streptomyces]QZZ30052.1 hypothetical protein A7X85_30820 [Streptomyces sp. ST1015]